MSDQETNGRLSGSGSHLSFQRRDCVLQLLLQLRWHQTLDLLLVLPPYLRHLTETLREQTFCTQTGPTGTS